MPTMRRNSGPQRKIMRPARPEEPDLLADEAHRAPSTRGRARRAARGRAGRSGRCRRAPLSPWACHTRSSTTAAATSSPTGSIAPQDTGRSSDRAGEPERRFLELGERRQRVGAVPHPREDRPRRSTSTTASQNASPGRRALRARPGSRAAARRRGRSPRSRGSGAAPRPVAATTRACRDPTVATTCAAYPSAAPTNAWIRASFSRCSSSSTVPNNGSSSPRPERPLEGLGVGRVDGRETLHQPGHVDPHRGEEVVDQADRVRADPGPRERRAEHDLAQGHEPSAARSRRATSRARRRRGWRRRTPGRPPRCAGRRRRGPRTRVVARSPRTCPTCEPCNSGPTCARIPPSPAGAPSGSCSVIALRRAPRPSAWPRVRSGPGAPPVWSATHSARRTARTVASRAGDSRPVVEAHLQLGEPDRRLQALAIAHRSPRRRARPPRRSRRRPGVPAPSSPGRRRRRPSRAGARGTAARRRAIRGRRPRTREGCSSSQRTTSSR